MKTIEFAKEKPLTVILLHGGGLSWWSNQEIAERLAQRYHVVIPFLDGHAGSDRDFTTMEDAAEALWEYIHQQLGSKVFAISGLSLGGQILVELLSNHPMVCQYAIIESALVIPMTFTNRLVGPMIQMSYGLIQKRWFAQLQFQQLHLKKELFDPYYTDTCKIRKENMIAFLKCNSSYQLKDSFQNSAAKAAIVVGGKEGRKLRRSAALLHKALPSSRLVVFPKYRHGDFSINHAENYVELFDLLIGQ